MKHVVANPSEESARRFLKDQILRENRMEMKHVKSSQIHSIGFDETTGTLGIRFWGSKKPNGDREAGTLYHYPNFTADKFKQFSESESKGKFFGSLIKGVKDAQGNPLHPHTKVKE